MYSVVLITALATATSGQGFCQRSHGCNTAHSCYTSCTVYHGYSGYCGYCGYSGYPGYSGHCHGGYSQSHGPLLYGCAGPGFGYHGGCHSAFGIYSGSGGYYDAYNGGTGCYGCHGGHSGYGYPVPFTPQAPPQGGGGGVRDPFPPINPDVKKINPNEEEVPAPKERNVAPVKDKNKIDDKDDVKIKKQDEPKKEEIKDKKKAHIDQTLPEGVRAKVRIHVPQGGQLYVDGNAIRVKPGVRVFQTPPLAPGERYYYDIRIDQTVNGEVLTDSRRVIIEPGQDVAVEFQDRQTYTAQISR